MEKKGDGEEEEEEEIQGDYDEEELEEVNGLKHWCQTQVLKGLYPAKLRSNHT